MLLKRIILTCHQQIGNERTISSVYHILQGKSSIQSLQDIHLFKLEKYYGIYKKLSKEEYSNIIKQLVADKYLSYHAHSDTYKITLAGSQWIEPPVEQLFFNGYQYKQVDDIFFQRLLLLIQVWTNSQKRQFKFIPIVDNYEVEQWVKLYYAKTKEHVEVNLFKMFQELTIILKHTPEQYAEIFVDQLSGYEHIGLTIPQLSSKYEYSIHDIYVINRHLIHILLREVLNNPEQLPILISLVENLHSEEDLTASTKQTLHLLNQGKTIEQIAQIRRLKINTVYDHIVEIALIDANFSITNYVPLKEEIEIMNAITTGETFRLKEIKDAVDSEISYFQIRLILTKIDDYI